MEILAVLALAFIFAPYIIGAWAHVRASRLEARNKTLADEIAALRKELALLRTSGGIEARPEAPPEEATETAQTVAPEDTQDTSPDEVVYTTTEAAAPRRPHIAFSREWLERQFGAVLPVWIGGVAIAFAGFFLVKYSIDNDLVGPQMRVVLGALLGGTLLAAARWIGSRNAVEPSGRIMQALNGAGLAIFYVSAYAATALYGLVTPFFGFSLIAAITGLAVFLSLRHGPPIALLGMVGGFLTPALMGSGNPSALTFFTYLFFVFAALMIVIRQRAWWILAIPALIAAFGWVLVWILSGGTGGTENIWLSLFLIAVAATIVLTTRERYAEDFSGVTGWRDLFSMRRTALFLNVFSIAGAMALMAWIAFESSFGYQEWLLYAALALGAISLAYFAPALYGFAPWAAMAINGVMLAGWFPQESSALLTALIAFGTLYVLSGFLLITGSVTPLLWAGLSVTAALGYYLIGFFRLTPSLPAPEPIAINIAPSTEPSEPLLDEIREVAASIPHEWAVAAMGLALAFLLACIWTVRRFPISATRDRVLAIYALATTAFIALAFFVEMDPEFLPVAIAAELLAVAWVSARTQLPALRPIAMLLGVTFAFLLIPQILLLAQLSLYSIFGIEWRVQETVPIVEFPQFQLALPAACFFLAAYLLRPHKDAIFVRMLETAGIALIALFGFYATAKLFHPGENVLFVKASFLERGVITNVLFLYGLACLYISRLFARTAFFQCGVLLTAVALFRIVYFDLLLKNPVWFGGEVTGPLPFDALALTYAVPVLWSWLASREIGLQATTIWLQRYRRILEISMLVMVFAWLTLMIRKFYQGPFLDGGSASDGEFYTYSVAWLIFALAMLVYGTLKGGQLLRYASLAVLLLTVSKVFLFDAGNLTGLYRVFSFLGLGLSLLGISYFYGRFVFGGPPDTSPPPDATREAV
ncbi:MAG: DUF2339 domain-containing protein [Hyphomicrobiales bacterium]|nr:DUF2339 domain-containing protein [Hyphomicrobiales bacterium]